MNHSLVSLDLSKFDQVAEPTETKAGLVNESDEQDSELKTRGTSDIAILSESQKTLEAEPDDEGAAQIKTLSPFSSPAGKNRFYCGSGEDDFLRAFIEDLQECGYDYKTQDIVRFHTCIKNGGFTLLGGISGCGKSTLVSLYARALLGKRLPNQDGVRFLAIDVNPAWSEPSDILGYWNLHEQYSCAPSGLVSFLRDSIKSNEVRLICLEEMNLARTEHYLSDFIQLMSRDQKDRVLLGVPLDVCGIRTDAKLPISETIRFVGTNNFDETTQRFSPRFYDRCNYIELQETGRSDEFPRFIPSVERGKFDYGVNYEMYEKWRGHDVRVDRLDKQVVTRFKDIVAKLLPLCLLPSPRVKQAILEYVLARPFFPGCGSDYHAEADCQLIALDESIAQRVLARYSVNYLRNEKAARDSLLEELKKDMPLSYALFLNKCNPGERPARV